MTGHSKRKQAKKASDPKSRMRLIQQLVGHHSMQSTLDYIELNATRPAEGQRTLH